jgi:hypothetical protein
MCLSAAGPQYQIIAERSICQIQPSAPEAAERKVPMIVYFGDLMTDSKQS